MPVSIPIRLRAAAASLLAAFVLSACQATSSSVPPGGEPLGAAGADVPWPARVVIGAVQGTGLRSPMVGRQVTVEGIITGNFSDGLGGVFVQSARDDGDPATAEGLFVLRDAGANADGVALRAGDRVRVAGTVQELGDDELTTLTALRDATFDVLGHGASVAGHAIAQAPDDASGWERLEGMRIRVTSALTVSGNGGLARNGELVASFGGRLYHATERAAPGPGAAAIAADNARRTLVLDDARTARDPASIWFLPQPVSDAAPLRAGSQLDGVEGIVDERFGDRRLQLTAPLRIRQAPRPPAPDVPGNVRVASFNLLNLFNGDGRGGGFPTGRGARTEAQYRVQQAKLVAVVQALRPDVAALMEVENDGSGPDSALAGFVAALNARGPARDYALVDSGARLGGDAIRVAMIYRRGRVARVGKPASLTGGPFDNRSRVPLAQAFRAGRGPVFVVAANHFKSKGCGRDADAAAGADRDQGDGQGCWNPVRIESARRVAAWLAGDPTNTRAAHAVVLGDLNAYAMEEPVRALLAAGWRDAFALAASRDPGLPPPYSYVFDGRAGRLDHALVDASLGPRLRGVVEWHNNADESPALDYSGDASVDPYRASDHDPILLGLDLRR